MVLTSMHKGKLKMHFLSHSLWLLAAVARAALPAPAGFGCIAAGLKPTFNKKANSGVYLKFEAQLLAYI